MLDKYARLPLSQLTSAKRRKLTAEVCKKLMPLKLAARVLPSSATGRTPGEVGKLQIEGSVEMPPKHGGEKTQSRRPHRLNFAKVLDTGRSSNSAAFLRGEDSANYKSSDWPGNAARSLNKKAPKLHNQKGHSSPSLQKCLKLVALIARYRAILQSFESCKSREGPGNAAHPITEKKTP